MKSYPECIACLFKQTLQAQQTFTLSDGATREVMNTLGASLPSYEEGVSPPVIATVIQHELERLLGVDDPYRDIKHESSNRILEHLDGVRHVIRSSADPLRSAALLAIGGNAIDYGVFGNAVDVEKVIRDALGTMESTEESAHSLAYEEYKEHLSRSSRLLYILDNAGEVVFDRLLIETMKQMYPDLEITVAVRNRPILNDVTLSDAHFAGIDQVADALVVSSCDSAGAVIGQSGPAMQKAYHEADIIIAKGQGNYEAMSDEEGPVYFFLKVKCPAVSRETGEPVGTYLLKRGRSFQ
ncbi:MAG: DUF89 family protein [Sphaerochaetaceae bacterium]|nr:DUF89 family protein [Sphaerochaetaceae bacterium]